MGRAQVGDTLQLVLVCDGRIGRSVTLTVILYCFTAATFIPHSKLSLPKGYGPCVHPTSPFARCGAYASDCTEGVTKSEGNRGTNGDGDRVGVGNGIEIGNGDGGERSNTRQKQGHQRERRLEEEIESGTKIETEIREEEKPDIRHIKQDAE